MIPLLLTLKNFMSYGDDPVTVDLRDMPIICLSGDNGHGKSAILDAITWALWGETRLGKQNHEQLIRLGADEMSVVLEFQVGEDVYRVRRQRTKRTAGQLWELQIRQADLEWRALSGVSSSDTGRIITQILRMSYDTFLNSAYLKQGRADEFVRQSANRRKEILAEILDLSRYDELEAMARTKMRFSHEAALDATRDLQQIERELATELEVRRDYSAAKADVQRLSEHRHKLQVSIDNLQTEQTSLVAQRSNLQNTELRIKDIVRQLETQNQAIRRDNEALTNQKEILSKREQIEDDFKQHQSLSLQLPDLRLKASMYRELEKKRFQLERDISDERRRLEYELGSFQKRQPELQMIVDKLPEIEGQIRVVESEISKRNLVEVTLQDLITNKEQKSARFHEIKAEKSQADLNISALKERLVAIDQQKEKCSICGNSLPESKRLEIKRGVELSLIEIEKIVHAYIAEGKALKTELTELDNQIRLVSDRLKEIEAQQHHMIILQQTATDIRKQFNQLDKLNADIQAVTTTLQLEQFAINSRQQLASIILQINAVAQAEADLKNTEQLLTNLSGVEVTHSHIALAEQQLAKIEQTIANTEAIVQILESQRSNLTEQIASLPKLELQIADITVKTDGLKLKLKSIDTELDQLKNRAGRLEQQLERIEEIKKQKVKLESNLQSAINEEELYTLLAGAFGKRGVQALIIENTLPELESDTNELLEKLTDGEMSVTIQAYKAAKGKSTQDSPIETLEINISDHMGTRALEMYSGGESFRVSFALRIALSKLLTRRAGAELQTLIIDEGFGTQDGKGREKLVDAIMAIQGEFAQIIVITHVEELKEAFPHRIEVVKTPTGSMLSVMSGAALG